MTKMTMFREKCKFCNLQNCHFVCHVFVIWWKICHFFVVFGAIFSKTGKNIEHWLKNDRKMTKTWQCFERNAIFATCKIVMLFVIFCHLVENLSFFVVVVQFSPKYGKISKLDWKMTEKWPQNDNASRKMQFLQPAKLSFCLSFFVIWWKIVIFCRFGIIMCIYNHIIYRYYSISCLNTEYSFRCHWGT